MAYEKQTWVTGEVITKEKLNHMEDGIANSGGGSEKQLTVLSFDVPQFGFKPGYSSIQSIILNTPIKKESIKSVWFISGADVLCSFISMNGSDTDVYQLTFICTYIRTETDTRSEIVVNSLKVKVLVEETAEAE